MSRQLSTTMDSRNGAFSSRLLNWGFSEFIGLILTKHFEILKVEFNPLWQQKKLREFCETNGVLLTAYSVLGASVSNGGSNKVMECEQLKEIARAKGKTVAQVRCFLSFMSFSTDHKDVISNLDKRGSKKSIGR